MAYAKPDDVATSLLRGLTPVEAEYVSTLLDRVEAIIASRIPDLDTRVAADATFLANVITVEANAVARVFRNPDGYNQEADGSYSYSVNSLVASGYLGLSDDDWTLLGVLTDQVRSVPLRLDEYARTRRWGLNPQAEFNGYWYLPGEWGCGS